LPRWWHESRGPGHAPADSLFGLGRERRRYAVAAGRGPGYDAGREQAKSQAKAQPTAQSKTPTKAGAGSGSSTFKRQGLGVGVEGAEALGYSYYLNAMLTRVSDNWLNPYAGQAKVLTATVVFDIERDEPSRT